MTRKPEVPKGPKLLLAEGKDEQYLLPELLELAGIPWPKPHPVQIHRTDGVDSLLDLDEIEAIYLDPTRVAIGLVVDANGDIGGRWRHVRAMLASIAPGFPEELDRAGIVHQEENGPRLGVWLMPDNVRAGMLETLLLAIRKDGRALWAHVSTSVEEARAHGATYRDPHRDKAELHTWLAWQDPPGQALGTAAKAHHFDVQSPSFAPFVSWFRRLFGV